jgi:hypothetical protein
VKTILAGGAAVVAVMVLGPFGNTGTILPQHGIAGARLHQSVRQVEAALGPPVRVVDRRNEFGPYRELRYDGLTVVMQGRRRVTGVFTRSQRHRTDGGVGVGSTREKVVESVDGIRCEADEPGVERCLLGALEPGRTVTEFLLRDGRVRRVTIGIVID